MSLDDVLDLHDYWQAHPPVQWMVQAYLGIKPASVTPTPSDEEAAAFLRRAQKPWRP